MKETAQTINSEIQNPALLAAVNKIVEKHEGLENRYGISRQSALLPVLKEFAKAGPIEYGQLLYIQNRLCVPPRQAIEVGSFYDMTSPSVENSQAAKDILGVDEIKGARGDASEKLTHRFLGKDAEDLRILRAGTLLSNIGPESYTMGNHLRNGGYKAFEKALFEMTPEDIRKEVTKSGLRGRGGAYFKVGDKWESAIKSQSNNRFLICNADEGLPMTRKDKKLMENKPHQLIESMLIAGRAVGAKLGLIYIRGDYDLAIDRLKTAIKEARVEGYLGDNIRGSGFDFEIEVVEGAGSYVLGADTAQIQGIQGKRGKSQLVGPYPTEGTINGRTTGLAGQSTVVNNVETLFNLPEIVTKGGEHFSKIGTEGSTGTKLYGICGDVNQRGLVEAPMGELTIKQLIDQYGNGVKGESVKAVLPGDVATGFLPERLLDTRLDRQSLIDVGSNVGSGAVVVMNEKTDMVGVTADIVEFNGEESCGGCVSGRSGLKTGLEIFDRLRVGEGRPEDLEELHATNEYVTGKYAEELKAMEIEARGRFKKAKCGLCQTCMTEPVTAMKHFPEEFEARIRR